MFLSGFFESLSFLAQSNNGVSFKGWFDYLTVAFALLGGSLFLSASLPHLKRLYTTNNTAGVNKKLLALNAGGYSSLFFGSIAFITDCIFEKDLALFMTAIMIGVYAFSNAILFLHVFFLKQKNAKLAKQLGLTEVEYYRLVHLQDLKSKYNHFEKSFV